MATVSPERCIQQMAFSFEIDFTDFISYDILSTAPSLKSALSPKWPKDKRGTFFQVALTILIKFYPFLLQGEERCHHINMSYQEHNSTAHANTSTNLHLILSPMS